MRTIQIVDYDPAWPAVFAQLRSRVWAVVEGVAVAVEHVGSTSVPDLAAKPIIDMTVVVGSTTDVPAAIERLAALGYVHQGNLGVDGREAFGSPDGWPAHHLYLCARDNVALENHLALRDYLRAHPESARAYADLKKRLASQFPHDMGSYVEGKTGLILEILRDAGFPPDRLDAIARANRR
jgi:GrpB-like predicted nucleotidyltransferase (UPF0157 family)